MSKPFSLLSSAKTKYRPLRSSSPLSKFKRKLNDMSYSDFCEKCFGVLYNYEIVFQHKCCTLIGQASKSGVLSGFHP